MIKDQFQESSLFTSKEDEILAPLWPNNLGCTEGTFPFSYLGRDIRGNKQKKSTEFHYWRKLKLGKKHGDAHLYPRLVV